MPVAYIQALKVTATNDCNYINTVVSYANPSAPFPLTGNLVFKNMGGVVLNASPITAVITSSGDSVSVVTATADIPIYQGKFVMDAWTYSSGSQARYTLSNDNTDIKHLFVNTKEDASISNYVDWLKAGNVVNITACYGIINELPGGNTYRTTGP